MSSPRGDRDRRRGTRRRWSCTRRDGGPLAMMTRLLRIGFYGFTILSLTLILGTCASLVRSAHDDTKEAADFELAPRSFGVLRSGATAPVVFKVMNKSDRVINILGVSSSTCNPCGCMRICGVPQRIAPRTRGEITVWIEARRVGDFDNEASLFTDIPGATTVSLRVVGRVTN